MFYFLPEAQPSDNQQNKTLSGFVHVQPGWKILNGLLNGAHSDPIYACHISYAFKTYMNCPQGFVQFCPIVPDFPLMTHMVPTLSAPAYHI